MFTIDKDYELNSYHTGMTETMRKLDIGHSFICPIRLRSSAYQCANQIGIKVMTSKQGDNVRIVRIG